MATQILGTVGKDFGGYWSIGRQGNLGSLMSGTVGKAYGAWVRTYDYTVTPLMLTWFGVTNMGNSYNMFMLNTGWTTDYQPMSGCVLVDVQGNAGTGWAYWANVTGSTVNFNDGKFHHHFVSFSGFSGGKPTVLKYYVDGIEYNLLGGNDISDPGGLGPQCVNFASASYVGCDGKTDAMTPVDMATMDVEDMRIYDRALSSYEVQQIFKLRGRDNIKRGLRSRYPWWTDGRNLGPFGETAISRNNGGGSSSPIQPPVKALSAARRKVM